jgi:hypothetical protein
MKRTPLILTMAYLTLFASVLIKNVCWSVGDQTDVIRVGIASFPIGLILSFTYPGDRNGAFAAVSLAALLNAAIIYFVARRIIQRSRT